MSQSSSQPETFSPCKIIHEIVLNPRIIISRLVPICSCRPTAGEWVCVATWEVLHGATFNHWLCLRHHCDEVLYHIAHIWMECFLGAHDQYQLLSANASRARRSLITSYQLWRCSLIISICTTNGIQSIGNLSKIIKSKIWSFFPVHPKPEKQRGNCRFKHKMHAYIHEVLWDLRSGI